MTNDPWRYRCLACGSVQIWPIGGGWQCSYCKVQNGYRYDAKTEKVIT